MSERFLWIEWQDKDSKIRRARVPFKERLVYQKYSPEQYEILRYMNLMGTDISALSFSYG